MYNIKLDKKYSAILDNFTRTLTRKHNDKLVSIIAYGSAVSGEFINKHSDINILVVLKEITRNELKDLSEIINQSKFRIIKPLFLTEKAIFSSTDVFPIEFLDIKENYLLLQGKDIFKEIKVDLKNLRFQCEQELKTKLINLRQAYLRINKNKPALKELLFKAANSIIHILRNVLRLNNIENIPYLKNEVLESLTKNLNLTTVTLNKIVAVKNKKINLDSQELDCLFLGLIEELDKITEAVDKLN